MCSFPRNKILLLLAKDAKGGCQQGPTNVPLGPPQCLFFAAHQAPLEPAPPSEAALIEAPGSPEKSFPAGAAPGASCALPARVHFKDPAFEINSPFLPLGWRLKRGGGELHLS